MRALTMTIMLAACSATAAVHADQLLTTLHTDRSGLWRMADMVFDNDALGQWRMSAGLTTVNVGYGMRHDNGVVNPMLGSSDYNFSGSAETYTKYKSTTLGGSARYTNGRRRDVQWCETSDPDIIYPYIQADAAGGDIKFETYAFSGSYAQHTDNWAWGGSLAYKATLEYRDIDPRPRNVAGCLDAALSGARRCGNYWLGADIDFRRYTQGNDIDFKSEMGVDKVYHLTGMLRHYVRFAGTGSDSHYQGYRYGAGVALYPESGHGAFVRIHASQFRFDNILTELNKLPMASATHRSLEAQAGFLSPGDSFYWGVNATIQTHRRHGRENIFGDAASGVYPLIASIDMFADNGTDVSVNAMAGYKWHYSDLSVRLSPSYSYRSSLYLSPYAMRRIRAWVPQAEIDYSVIMPHRWLLSATVSATVTAPYGCRYEPGSIDPELEELQAISERVFGLDSHSHQYYSATLTGAHSINSRLGLSMSAGYGYAQYHGNVNSNSINIIFGLIF